MALAARPVVLGGGLASGDLPLVPQPDRLDRLALSPRQREGVGIQCLASRVKAVPGLQPLGRLAVESVTELLGGFP